MATFVSIKKREKKEEGFQEKKETRRGSLEVLLGRTFTGKRTVLGD